ncbi:DUF5799 family protein [Halovenus rubra]|uniref:DUF5799 family protein n=2 Tax=Halovenus rubra TaxID=869890 RepID=A0ACC7DXM4_9EURY|nr:DUF5799 family protein [Halovenus rubra]
MSNQWRDRLAGARMQVDKRFDDRIRTSEFTNQQWGLIMTAVEFDIDNPEQPESAELVAKTDQVEHIIPELDNVPQGMGGAPMGQQQSQGGSGDGLLGKIRGFLGGNDDSGQSDEETLQAASALVGEYADELQQFLEEEGQWTSLCESAAAAK